MTASPQRAVQICFAALAGSRKRMTSSGKNRKMAELRH